MPGHLGCHGRRLGDDLPARLMIESANITGHAPDIDEDSVPFWEGLAEGRLVVARCGACGRLSFPPTASCPSCGKPATTPHIVSGQGSVYSWIRVHAALDPAFANDVPYVILTVSLDEDPDARVTGRLLNDPGTPLEAGAVVRLAPYRVAEDIVLPGFTLNTPAEEAR
jgi:uncharacterized protein